MNIWISCVCVCLFVCRALLFVYLLCLKFVNQSPVEEVPILWKSLLSRHRWMLLCFVWAQIPGLFTYFRLCRLPMQILKSKRGKKNKKRKKLRERERVFSLCYYYSFILFRCTLTMNLFFFPQTLFIIIIFFYLSYYYC